MTESVNVQHEAASRRFCVKLQGYEACLMYRLSGKEIDLYHTYVPEVFRGKGVAEQLCKAAFEYAKAEGFTVIPSCSYISGAYLKRHPEYEPLTKRGRAARRQTSDLRRQGKFCAVVWSLWSGVCGLTWRF